jgi:hypothetical protein
VKGKRWRKSRNEGRAGEGVVKRSECRERESGIAGKDTEAGESHHQRTEDADIISVLNQIDHSIIGRCRWWDQNWIET